MSVVDSFLKGFVDNAYDYLLNNPIEWVDESKNPIGKKITDIINLSSPDKFDVKFFGTFVEEAELLGISLDSHCKNLIRQCKPFFDTLQKACDDLSVELDAKPYKLAFRFEVEKEEVYIIPRLYMTKGVDYPGRDSFLLFFINSDLRLHIHNPSKSRIDFLPAYPQVNILR
jgi:hypothetical protein